MEPQSQTGRRRAELSPSVTAHRAQVVSTYCVKRRERINQRFINKKTKAFISTLNEALVLYNTDSEGIFHVNMQ